MNRFLLALGFLTILPSGQVREAADGDMARSGGYFPLVGLLQGLMLVLADFALGRVFQPEISLALLVLLLVLSNGGFHLDGLADTFDALAAKGGTEGKLRAMKDSATGPIGVTAVVLALGIKYLALKGISGLAPLVFYSALALMPVVSKWSMLVCMKASRPAREDGLGRVFASGLRGRDLAFATLQAAFLVTLPMILAPGQAGHLQMAGCAAGLAVVFSSALALSYMFGRSFGGLTGDTLGASAEISEILFLLTVIAWQRFYIS